MSKKKFFGLLVILSLVFCLDLSCISYAWTIDDLVAYSQQLIEENAGFNYKANLLIRYQDNVKAAIGNLGYTGFVMDSAANTFGYATIRLYNTTFGGTVTDTQINDVTPLKTHYLTINQNNGSVTLNTNGTNTAYYQANNSYGLVESNITDWKNMKFNGYVPPASIYFTPENDGIITIGNNSNVNALKYGYSVPQWKIGETTGFEDLYYYEITLYDNVNRIYIGTSTGSSLGTSNDNALYYQGNILYVNSRYIRYNQLYWLNVLKYTDRYTFTEENYWFYFLPPNAVIENGVIVSSGDGSFDTQDSTNEIINNINDDENVDNILNEYLPSGDIETIARENFGFTVLDNPFTTFLIYVVESIYNALTVRANVTLSANYKNYLNFELHSEDFTTPDTSVKSFVKLLLVFVYMFGNYKFFHYLISLLETANINRFIAVLGTDEFYDSDIM